MTKEIDLGGDEGYVVIKVCGHPITVSPSEELDAIQKNSEATNRKSGNDLMAVVQERIVANIKAQCGEAVKPSPYVALAYWQTMLQQDEEIADSFSKRLALLSITDSTAEPPVSAKEECSPISPASAD